MHNSFSTYSIKDRATGEWFKVIDDGWLTVLDDPDVVRAASLFGEPRNVLGYDWIPTIPGINYPGDYTGPLAAREAPNGR